MKLIIAEKPSMAKDIASVLGAKNKKTGYFEGNGYAVAYAYGHLVEITNPQATNKWSEDPMPILSDFTLTPKKSGISQLNVLKKLLGEASEIICATDAGREGELIFRYIYHWAGCKKPFKRLWISSLTQSAIQAGFSNLKPGTQYDNLYLAAKARNEADWYVGVNATRALTLGINNKEVFSLGRVQTPTLAIICKRFLEHKNFVSEPFFTLVLKTQKDGTSFVIKPSQKFLTSEDAERVKNSLGSATYYTVTEVNKKEKKELQPLLYDLTGLQKKASSKYGITPDKTLEIAQKLYESKFITYPRTGSSYISNDVFDTVPELILVCKSLDLGINTSYYQSTGITLSKRSVDSSKVTDHHALLPTNILPNLDMLTKYEKIIYTMIVSRVFEAFHKECIKDVTEVRIDVPEIGECKVIGSTIKQAGWREVLKSDKETEDSDEIGEETSLPQMVAGDKLPNDGIDIIADKTKPKPLLTDATLLDFMETAGREIEDEKLKEAIKDCGLGTPATRDSIISKLIDKNYIVREKKKLIPTEKGLATYEIVKDKTIASPELTGSWERQLNNMAIGRYVYETFMKEIKTYAKNLVEEFLVTKSISIKSQKQLDSEAMPICPKCKTKNIRLFEKGIGCPDKECGFVLWRKIAGKELSDIQMKTLADKGKTSAIDGFVSSKTNKPFKAILKLKSDYTIEFEFAENKPSKNTKK